MPLFRSLLAKELVETHHMKQKEVAKRLGTTQAAVSQYVNSKRAVKGGKQFGDFLPRIQAMAVISAAALAKSEVGAMEATLDMCEFCSSLFDRDQTKAGRSCKV